MLCLTFDLFIVDKLEVQIDHYSNCFSYNVKVCRIDITSYLCSYSMFSSVTNNYSIFFTQQNFIKFLLLQPYILRSLHTHARFHHFLDELLRSSLKSRYRRCTISQQSNFVSFIFRPIFNNITDCVVDTMTHGLTTD